MKRATLLLLTFAAAIGSASAMDNCGSLAEARQEYEKGHYVKALMKLQCMKDQHPADLDVRRLLSDVLYWKGADQLGLAEATEALAITDLYPEFDPFDERRLHFLDRLSNLKISGDLSFLQDGNSSGTDGSLQTDYRYSDLGHVLLGAYHTARSYTGDVEVSDWHFSVGHILTFSPQFYLVNSFEYSPEAVISAKWATGITPHLVFRDDSDLSIEFRVNHYTTNTVYQISPAWGKAIFEDWSLGLQFYSLFTYHWIFAGEAYIEHPFSSRVFGRVTAADGKAVEGPGLEDDFRSASLALGFRIRPTLSLIPNAGVYRAELRNENYAGLGFELKL